MPRKKTKKKKVKKYKKQKLKKKIYRKKVKTSQTDRNNSERENVSSATNGGGDLLQGAYGFTYTMGPVSVGAAKSYINNDDGATQTVNYYENDNWSIAFNVNDNLSVSYAEWESEEHMGTTGGQTLKVDSVQIAYNMGGATLQIADTDGSETKYSAGASNHVRTINLSLAF